MTTGNPNARRVIPRSFFAVTIPDIDTIGLFTECSGLDMEMETYEYAEGGRNDMVHALPTRMRYPRLVLRRGLTKEKALIDWFEKTKTKAELKEITVILNDHRKQMVRSWAVQEAYPVKWSGPALHAGVQDISMESLEISHSGIRAL